MSWQAERSVNFGPSGRLLHTEREWVLQLANTLRQSGRASFSRAGLCGARSQPCAPTGGQTARQSRQAKLG